MDRLFELTSEVRWVNGYNTRAEKADIYIRRPRADITQTEADRELLETVCALHGVGPSGRAIVVEL